MDSPLSNDQREEIAIVGMAGRYPAAADLEVFWDNLKRGVESVRFFRPEELIAAGVKQSHIDHPQYVPASAALEQADCFDAAFFGYTPVQAKFMDPQQRLLLECAYQTLEDAACDPDRFEGLIGVFCGIARNEYFYHHASAYLDLLDQGALYDALLSSEKDYPATRIAYKLNLRGPSLNVQTACSSSGVAVHLACQSLLQGECDMALAGGARIRVPLKAGYIYFEGGIPSPDGHCRAFDTKANGCIFGNGVGMIALKRLSDAVANGDAIRAIIKGSAINNDGAAKVGFTAPSVVGQSTVIDEALAVAEVDASTIDWIEAHGTGTKLGDPIEIAALTKAFRKYTDKVNYCHIGSVKTNIGHLDAGAAVAGIIKTVLSLQHEAMPPSVNFEQPNPQIPFADSPFVVNAQLRPWKRNGTPRRAGVSSFGLGGTNFHAILEEAPQFQSSDPGRSWQLLPLSAKTPAALQVLRTKLAAYLRGHLELPLPDVAFSLQTGRQELAHRTFVVCCDHTQAAEGLEVTDRSSTLQVSEANPSVVFMFPGQGAQHVNMGHQLYQEEPTFAKHVDLLAEEAEPVLGKDLRTVVHPGDGVTDSAARQLEDTVMAQPALFMIQYALAMTWMDWGIYPAAMIGHSIGEYVAACLAGVLTPREAIKLVARRAMFMQQQPSGSMLAVRLSPEKLEEFLGDGVDLAACNAPGACVVSGPDDRVQRLGQKLEAQRIQVRPLHTSHAFHSPMMDPVVQPYVDEVRKITLQRPRCPYISSLTGTWIKDQEATDPEYWGQQLRCPVRFSQGVSELATEPNRIYLEVGPGKTLTTLCLQHGSEVTAGSAFSSWGHPLEQKAELACMMAALGGMWTRGVPVPWQRLCRGQRRLRVPLPTYPFEAKRHWLSNNQTEDRTDLPSRQRDAVDQADLVAKETAPTTATGHANGDGRSSHGAMDRVLPLTPQTTASSARVAIVNRQLTLMKKQLRVLADRHRRDTASLPTQTPVPDSSVVAMDLQPADVGRSSAAVETDIPATEEQLEIWRACQIGHESSCSLNLSYALSFLGPFDPKAMRRAIEVLVQRHDALRMTFSRDGKVVQFRPTLALDVPMIDLSQMSDSQRRKGVADQITAELDTAFDLAHGPHLRAKMIKRDHEDHLLLLTIHHIATDGFSSGTLIRELGQWYSAAGEETSQIQPMQYSQYARWQADQRLTTKYQEDEQYWIKQCSDPLPAPVRLPTDRQRPPIKTFNGAAVFDTIRPSLCQALKRSGAQRGCTLFCSLLGGFTLWLHQLTEQGDLVVAIPASGQSMVGRHDLIGHCAHHHPLRSRIDPARSVVDHVDTIRRLVLDAHEHRNYTEGSLHDRLSFPPDPSRFPLLNIQFTMDPAPLKATFRDMESTVALNPRIYTATDLNFNLVEENDEVRVRCEYNTDLFDCSTITQWLKNFIQTLQDLVDDPQRPVTPAILRPPASKPSKAPMRVDLDTLVPDLTSAHKQITSQLAIRGIETYPELPGLLNDLCAAHAWQYLSRRCDLVPGATLSGQAIAETLGVSSKFMKFLVYMLRVLDEDGWLEFDQRQDTVSVRQACPNPPEAICDRLHTSYPQFRGLVDLLVHCAKHYPDALAERIPAITVLFPDGSRGLLNRALCEQTVEHRHLRTYKLLLKQAVIDLARRYRLSILEAGGGSGDLTWLLAHVLRGESVRYTFSDIGQVFVNDAKVRAAQLDCDFMDFHVFDISKDPVSQGLGDNRFDLVLAMNVVHATSNLDATLEHLHRVLAPGGLLGMIEFIKSPRWEHFIWGLAQGWWYFQDPYRDDGPLVSLDGWSKLLSKRGFDRVAVFPSEEAEIGQTDTGLILGQKKMTSCQ